MSLLESMRSGTDSTAMQVLLALVLVSFVFWFSSPSGDTTSVVATVNGTQIMGTDLSRAYAREARQYDRALSDDDESQLRERVRQDMIEDEVVLQEARRLGLEVSDTEVARMLLDLEFLLNDEGAFDERIYDSFIRQQAYASRDDFQDDLRKDIVRRKLRFLIFTGITVSDPVLEDAYVKNNTRIDIRYARIRPRSFEDDVEATPELVEEWRVGNPERIKEVYEADFDRLYDLPEKVDLTMVRFAVRGDGLGVAELRPKLEALAAEIAAGADMAEMARKWSEHPTAEDGGAMVDVKTKQLGLPAVTAIGELAVGALSGVVVEDAHISIYRLDRREEARVIALEEVEAEIAERLLREEKAPALAAAFAEELLAEWQKGEGEPSALLDGQGIAAASTGQIPLKGSDGLFSPPDAMLRAAGKAARGAVLPEVYADGDILWVGQLVDRVDPDMDLFEDEKELVREEVLSERRMEFYKGYVDSLVADATIR